MAKSSFPLAELVLAWYAAPYSGRYLQRVAILDYSRTLKGIPSITG